MNPSILYWDGSHLQSNTPDASLVEYPGWERALGWKGTDPLPVPPVVTFAANLEVVRVSDYPINDSGWPIMSDRMRDILKTFPRLPALREIPVRMIARKGGDGEAIESRFAAVQLLEHAEVVDFERSEYEASPRLPGRVRRFTKLVLRAPEGGFQPLFRLSAYPQKLLVRADVRAALEAAGLRGIDFWGLEAI